MLNDKKLIAAFAVLAMLLAGSFVFSEESDAIGEDLSTTYGEATNINIAPGYRWTYTPEFPSDLTQYLTVSLQVNDGNIGSVSNKTITVNIPTSATVGTVYNIVIKASMTSPIAQTAYQYVTFTVVNGLNVSGTINDIVKGSNISFTPTGTSDMGAVSWAVTPGKILPAGLTFSNGQVSGIPTEIGLQTVYLTATANGQSKDLEVSFTVYSKIVGGEVQTIRSYNTTVSSDVIANGSDIGVTWAVTSGTLPEGFSLNSDTGVVSGRSVAVQSSTITITGTSSHGPSQSATKQITIQSEPALTLSCDDSILTYKNNASEISVSITSSESSAKTWSVSEFNGASVDNGTLVVVNPTTIGMDQIITVTCSTVYGQTATVDIEVDVEDTLAISGDTTLNLLAGTEGSTVAFTVTGGSGNVMTASTEAAGLSVRIADGKLYAIDNSAEQDLTAIVMVTSAAGQTVTVDVDVNVFNQLVFSSVPTAGAIIYAV